MRKYAQVDSAYVLMPVTCSKQSGPWPIGDFAFNHESLFKLKFFSFQFKSNFSIILIVTYLKRRFHSIVLIKKAILLYGIYHDTRNICFKICSFYVECYISFRIIYNSGADLGLKLVVFAFLHMLVWFLKWQYVLWNVWFVQKREKFLEITLGLFKIQEAFQSLL